MKKNKKQLILILVPLLLVISALSGCVGPWAIDTLGWIHANQEGTAVKIEGRLKLIENPKNWNLGFAWDTQSHSNWDEYPNRMEANTYLAGGVYTLEISDLDRTTKYYYRAWGEYTLQQSEVRQGVERTFIPGGPDVVNRPNQIEIGLTSAIVKGELLNMGGADSCDIYFEYGINEQLLDMETESQTLTSDGLFSAEITGLSSCILYYYRAVATNDADTAVSAVPPFLPWFTPGMPIMVTEQPTDVGTSSALFRGNTQFLGGESSCDVWFEYDDKDQYPPFELKTIIQTMNAPGSFQANVEDLKPGTTYFVMAVGNNGECKGTGEVEQFTTQG